MGPGYIQRTPLMDVTLFQDGFTWTEAGGCVLKSLGRVDVLLKPPKGCGIGQQKSRFDGFVWRVKDSRALEYS